MSRGKRSRRPVFASLLWWLGYASLFVLSFGLAQSLLEAPATEGTHRLQDREAEYRRELHSYIWGVSLALLLTFAPFALVFWSPISRFWLLIAIFVFAFIQIVVHFRFFLHIDPPKQNTNDLQLILFSSFIILLMAGGTIWVMANLAIRMMG